MHVELFDDKLSLGHIPMGVLSYFFPFLVSIFLLYEFVEYLYKGDYKEPKAHYLGDISEFLVGIAIAHLVVKGLGI